MPLEKIETFTAAQTINKSQSSIPQSQMQAELQGYVAPEVLVSAAPQHNKTNFDINLKMNVVYPEQSKQYLPEDNAEMQAAKEIKVSAMLEPYKSIIFVDSQRSA